MRPIKNKVYLCIMEHTQLLRAILPDVLIDNFDVCKFDKTSSRFDIWLDEKKVMMHDDKKRGRRISSVGAAWITKCIPNGQS